jgi:hypothetical protein
MEITPNTKRLPWSKEDMETLKLYYNIKDKQELASLLNRSKSALAAKAQELGLCASNKWTDEDQTWLENNFDKYKATEMAVILNKTQSAIEQRVAKSKLRKMLKGYINIPIEEIDKKVREGKSLHQIALEYQVNTMSLKRYCKNQDYDVTANRPDDKKRKSGPKSAKNSLYKDYKYRAVNKNLEFTLTFEEFDKLTDTNCQYCDKVPTNIKYANGNKKVFCYYNGIDRVDNKQGYKVENCSPCCELCNKIKLDLTLTDFLSHIEKILKKCRN